MGLPKNVAIIGFGEAGSIMAEGLLSGSAQLNQPMTVGAWDIRLKEPGEKEKLALVAKKIGVNLYDDPGDWLGEVDAVFSLVFGGVAGEVALNILKFLKENAVYIDLTTSVPEDMQRTAVSFSSQKVGFIDGTALGSFRTNGLKVPFVLSGSEVEKWSHWLNSLGFNTTPVPGAAGNASSVKLLRSILAKGLEALAIECFAAADSLGLRETMMKAFNDFDSRPLVEALEDMGSSHVPHCQRRLDEINHTLDLLKKVKINPIMTEASRDFYARTVASGLKLPPAPKLNWAVSLNTLKQIIT